MYSFPSLISQLTFRPIKRPCTNVQLIPDENESETYIHWTPGKSSMLTDEETYSFIDDTGSLLLSLSMVSVTLNWNGSVPSEYKDFDLQCVKYFEKWGPLHPIVGKRYRDTNKSYYKTNLIELVNLGLTEHFIGVFWHSPDDDIVIHALERFFALVLSCNEYYTDHPDEKNEKPTIWYAFPTNDDNNYPIIDWAHGKEKLISKGALSLYFLHPSDKELENILNDDEAKINWVKKNLLQNIADYINKQSIKYQTTVRGNNISLEGETSNLFLSYIIGYLMGSPGRKAKFCECGCGRLVPPSRDKYVSEICRTRYRDKADKRRQVKNWLRTNKNRGNVDPQLYDKLRHLINELYSSGYEPEEIRFELKKYFK